MLSEKEILRYDRQIKLDAVGIKGQEKLKAAKVLIIGAGGLGCPVIQYLAAAGIGHLTIIDGDVISESNLQRQILYNQNEIGLPKAETAAKKAQLLNPHIHVTHISDFLNNQYALNSFKAYDLIIDCCDNFGTRYMVNDVCTINQIPFISSALFRLEGQIGTFNMKQADGTYSANYRDVFPEAQKSSDSLDCNEAGVISTLPGIMGMYQANEALKYFLAPEKCCINKIVIVNAWDFNQFELEVSPSPEKRKVFTKQEIETTNYHLPCKSHVDSIIDIAELNELLQQNTVLIVDVREEKEIPEIVSEKIIKAPLSTFENNLSRFSDKDNIVFVCKSGVRSKKALHLFENMYPHKKCYSFKYGIEILAENLVNHNYPITYA